MGCLSIRSAYLWAIYIVVLTLEHHGQSGMSSLRPREVVHHGRRRRQTEEPREALQALARCGWTLWCSVSWLQRAQHSTQITLVPAGAEEWSVWHQAENHQWQGPLAEWGLVPPRWAVSLLLLLEEHCQAWLPQVRKPWVVHVGKIAQRLVGTSMEFVYASQIQNARNIIKGLNHPAHRLKTDIQIYSPPIREDTQQL